MGKIRQVRVSLGATINLGNYENVKPEAEVVMQLDEGEDPETAFKACWDVCADQIRTQWATLKKVGS
jgi:hypothetical protein